MRGQKTFAAQARKTGAELEAMGVKGSKAATSLALTGQKLQSFGSKMSKYVTLPVIGAGVVAGKFAIDFDESMRNVNSIAQLPEKSLQKLEQQVLDMAGPTAQAPKTLADSLYDLVSSGFDANQSIQILHSSAKAATAGLTDAATSTKAIAAVLNAYHLPAKKAKDVSDVLFQTVNRGVISFEELSSTIGDVLPFAASLGVNLNQVGASVSTMTKAGINPAETMTRIKNVMVAMLKPSETLQKTIKGLGFESGEAMVKQLGFQGALDKLAKTTGGSKEEMAKLFPNIRALGGALALTGDNAAGAHKDLKALTDTAGATNKALGQQKQSLAYKWHQLSAQFQAIAIRYAPPLLDALSRLVGIVKSIGTWFDKLSDPVKKTAVQFIVLLAAVGPVTWALGALLKGPLAALAGAKGVILFVQGLTATMAALDVGVVTATSAMIGFDIAVLAIPVAIALAAAALVLLYLKVKAFRDAVNATWSWMKAHPFVTLLIPVIGPMIVIIQHFGQIKSAAQDALGWITGAAKDVKDALAGVVHGVAGFFANIFNKVKGAIQDAIGWVEDRVSDLINAYNSLPLLPNIDNPFDDSGPGAPAGPSGPIGPKNMAQLFGPAGPHGPRGGHHRALGGPVLPGGTAIVGERGPELATFPFGGQVFPHDKTARLLASGRDNPTITIPVYLNGRIIAEEVVRAGETAKARK